MMLCRGNCNQGRAPCDCELDADHGEFVSPLTKLIEDGLFAVTVLLILWGLVSIFMDARE